MNIIANQALYGDVVTAKFTVTDVVGSRVFTMSAGGRVFDFDEIEIDAIEKKPPGLGDTVALDDCGKGATGVILAILGDWAWIDKGDGGAPLTRRPSNLRRASN